MIDIQIVNARLHFTNQHQPVLQNLSMSFEAGTWTCLLGRSGCGKTSILKRLANLIGEDNQWQGKIITGDKNPLAGRIAYMAQQDLLLPWLNVLDNVCIGHRLQGHKLTPDVLATAHGLLIDVGLKDKDQATPAMLSGGMRQRVALARTLMQDKPVVLMDEPFSALDAVTRHKLQTLAFDLLKNRTVILITHDPQEAVRLGHKLYILSGTPASESIINLPNSSPPRTLDAQSAEVQQVIFNHLEKDFE